MSYDKSAKPPGRKRSAPDAPVYRHPDAGAPQKPTSKSEPRVTEREPVWARKPPGPSADQAPTPPFGARGAEDQKRSTAQRSAAPNHVWSAKPPARSPELPPNVSAEDAFPDETATGEKIFDRDAQRRREVRIFGRSACLAVARDRASAIRKIYYARERSRELAPVLERLAAARVGFREVGNDDLSKLAASQHHEGIVCDLLRKPQPAFEELASDVSREIGPLCLIALEGVGNPHNFGAILRSVVHFGVRAVLIPEDSTLTLAGAVYRVAEGAAERVDIVRYRDVQQLRSLNLPLIAAATSGDQQLYRDGVPARAVMLFGAEGAGLSEGLLSQSDHRLQIPGTGKVDSLNVAQAVAVVLGEWWRGHQS